MKKEFIKGIAAGITISLAVAAGGYAGYQIRDRGVLSDSEHVQKIRALEALIQRDYLGEIDENQLAEGLYAGLIGGLGDPYSRYYTAEEYKQENSATMGAYVGIGVTMQKNLEGGVEIVECYEGGPASNAGVKTGDIISAIDDTDITDMEVSEVADMIRDGKKKQAVLTIHRQNEETPLKLTVEITDVTLPSVFEEMLKEQVGYIRISEFTDVTPDQFREAFSSLKKQGMEKLIVDLRGNPGGLLTSVCSILNEILPEGLIVYTEDKYGERQEQKSEGKTPLDMPFAVLVNENSASASEIFAGAVQDLSLIHI